MMKKLYLAYGSNLNLEQMKKRCSYAIPIGVTTLNNYCLVYKGLSKGSAYLTIEEKEGSFVPVGIYEISFLDEISLNKYEGYPRFYHKKYLPITINNNMNQAMIYIMNSKYDYNLPSNDYVNICMKGYDDFNFDKDILQEAMSFTKSKLNNGRTRKK